MFKTKKVAMSSDDSGYNLVFGGEIFKWQRVGGISRVYQSVIPFLRGMNDVEQVFLYRYSAGKWAQPIADMVDGVLGIWLDHRKRPFRLRRFINTRMLTPINQIRMACLKNAVYISTHYSRPPVPIRSFCVVYDMTHERYPDSFDPALQRFEVNRKATALQSASRFLCISYATKNDLVSMYKVDPSRCDVVYLGGGERKPLGAQACEARDDARIRVLYVGDTKTPYKNFRFFVSALNQFASAVGDRVELSVVSSTLSLDMFRQQYGCDHGFDVAWHYRADDVLLNRLYRESDVFVFPSLWEGFGIPIVEALSWGCPVVCSDIPVFREIGEWVVDFFNPLSVSDFVVAMKRALAVGRSPVAVCARADHAAQFTWFNCANALLASIKKCYEVRTYTGRRKT
jgi:glycosyltransferase involved in cell wall biosynthesis